MKRRFAVLALMTAMAFACALHAGTFRVMVCPSNEEIESFIDCFFPTRAYDAAVLASQQERQTAAVGKERGEKLAKAYDLENASAIEEARELFDSPVEFDDEEEKPFDVVLAKASREFDAQTLCSDPVLLDYLCREYDTDLILIPYISSIQGFRHIMLYAYSYGDREAVLVFERLAQDSEKYTVDAALKIAPYFTSRTPALLLLEYLVPGTHIELDDSEVRALEDYVMTTEGRHTVRLSASGYEERYFATELSGTSVFSVDASMKAVVLHGLRLESTPAADVVVDGKTIGQTPLVLETYRLPFSATFEAEGYASGKLSLTGEPMDTVSVSLKPQWMADGSNLKKAKDGFYSDLARTIILFGVKVLARSFDDGTGTFFPALNAVADGALTISLVDLLGSLIDYYRTSEYVSE
ncbi:MAG: hypothetical protein J5775_05825 [Spirochaetales bacterium]|nr:hypothetical protein [Spirochaetales bacterium]